MKYIQSCILATLLVSFVWEGQAQTRTTQTPASVSATQNNAVKSDFTEVSLSKAKMTTGQELRNDDILWKRDVYRILEVSEGLNGALYYPVEPTPERKNLFCTIFDLVATGKLTAYEFKSDREDFSQSNVLKFKDLLNRFDIPFREKANPQKPNAPILDIEPVDIPSSEVTRFYIKEVYYLEQRNSTVGIKTLAICPVLIREDEYGKSDPYPMFWIPFSDLKAHLTTIPVQMDSINSVQRMNAYDFFNLRKFKGDIYKVSNLKNQTIYDYCDTPEARKAEQLRLENALLNLDASLWEPRAKAETTNNTTKKN